MTGFAAATTDMPKVDQSDTNKYNIQQSEGGQPGFFDGLAGLLSFSGVQSSYEPGEQISVEIEADTEKTYDTADATKVVEIYKCADSSCDTPPPIDSSSEDQCSSEEWYPDYDDCIAKNTDTVSFSVIQDSGTSWSWDTTFSGLQDEAEYILVGYVWTEDQGIVTDISKEQFTVQSSSDSGGTTDPEPDVREVDGDIPVKIENGEIKARPEFTNVGDGDMSESDIVEMQVRPEDTGLLSILSFTSAQNTCDSDHPENVHKQFRLDSGDTREVPLSTSTDNVAKGAWYDVWIVTREECGGNRAEPYGGGVIADTVYVEEDLQEATIRKGSESIDVTVTDSQVRAELALENVGDKRMSDNDIIEMQVRPKGEELLSTFSSTSPLRTCDTSHPENVHREYQIDAGDEIDVSLSTSRSNLEDGQQYDVWVITREECGGNPAQPYGTGVIADTVSLTDDTGGGDDGDEEIPVIPIAAVGLIIVLGGVLYRFR